MLLGTQFVISSELGLPVRRLYPETIFAPDRQLDIVKVALGTLVGHLSFARPRHFASLIAVVESLDLCALLSARGKVDIFHILRHICEHKVIIDRSCQHILEWCAHHGLGSRIECKTLLTALICVENDMAARSARTLEALFDRRRADQLRLKIVIVDVEHGYYRARIIGGIYRGFGHK